MGYSETLSSIPDWDATRYQAKRLHDRDGRCEIVVAASAKLEKITILFKTASQIVE